MIIHKPKIKFNFIEILIFLSFGPYLIKGLPLLLIDYLFYITTILILFKKCFIHKKSYTRFKFPLLIYLLILFVMLCSTFLNYELLKLVDFFSNLNRLLQFIFCYIIIFYFNFSFFRVALIYIFGISLNAIVILLQYLESPISNIIQKFWFVDYQESIAYNAAQLGRLTGVFKQPLEAGMAYSISLLLVSYFYIRGFKKVKFFLPFILVGGFFSISKIFILVGIPISLVYFFYNSNSSRSIYSLFFFIGIFYLALQLFENWESANYLFRLFDLDNLSNGLGFLTGSRFGGENTDVEELFFNVLNNSPILGFGIGSTKLMDNAIIEFLFQGGLICAMLYIIFSIYFFHRIKFIKEKSDKSFLLFFNIFLIISSIGSPIYTYNRFSLILFIILFHFSSFKNTPTKLL